MQEIEGLKGSQLKQIMKISSLGKELVLSQLFSTITATLFVSEVHRFFCIVAFKN